MIIEYHRPTTVEEALALLSRTQPETVPIGGGSALNRLIDRPVAIVDLQSLPLSGIESRGSELELGASLRLQTLADEIAISSLPGLAVLKQVLLYEASYNLRQVGTIAGTLVSCDGRSPFVAAMLALDAFLVLEPGSELVGLGELLPLRKERLSRRLITRFRIPTNVRLGFDYVARSPTDLPIVCAAVGLWPSGRTRVVLGGFGEAPVLAMDGSDAEGAEAAARSAYEGAGDQWGSAEYRQEIAGTLTRRVLQSLTLTQPR